MSASTKTLYVHTDGADCRYDRNLESPVRMTPSYGEAVELVERAEHWMLVRAFGKCGWVEASHLGKRATSRRTGV